MKRPKFNNEDVKFVVLQQSEVLIAKNGNEYIILIVEIKVGSVVQIQRIAFFLSGVE